MSEPKIPRETPTMTKEIAQGVRTLRRRISAGRIPPSRLDETTNIATWNLRFFGGGRSDRALFFIAEVLNQFDLIAITEVRSDLTDLAKVLRLLGPYWRVVLSDFIADSGGNWERVAYVYDKRAVVFTGLAAEANPPRRKIKPKNDGTTDDPRIDEYLSDVSWWRSPFLASFRSGRFDFLLITAHIRWDDHETDREEPTRLFADWLEKRREHKDVFDKDILVLGDFNVPGTKHKLFKLLTSRGLEMPDALLNVGGSNLDRDKRYDQILHYPEKRKRIMRGGVLDIFSDGIDQLFPGGDLNTFRKELSDHLPLWVQLDVDNEAQWLRQRIGGNWT